MADEAIADAIAGMNEDEGDEEVGGHQLQVAHDDGGLVGAFQPPPPLPRRARLRTIRGDKERFRLLED